MKKIVSMAIAVTLLAACQKNKEAEVIAKDPVTESTSVTHETTEGSIESDASAIPEAKQSTVEVKEVKPAKGIKVDYASFGDKILAEKAVSKEEMIKKYRSLKPGDTLNIKFKSNIKAVCQKKGCWMAMELPDGKESFVKFKDYAFFVPLNAADQEAIVSGKAFVSETSVAQLRHYAKDGGKSEADIAKITEPEFEYKFMADGVLISK